MKEKIYPCHESRCMGDVSTAEQGNADGGVPSHQGGFVIRLRLKVRCSNGSNKSMQKCTSMEILVYHEDPGATGRDYVKSTANNACRDIRA